MIFFFCQLYCICLPEFCFLVSWLGDYQHYRFDPDQLFMSLALRRKVKVLSIIATKGMSRKMSWELSDRGDNTKIFRHARVFIGVLLDVAESTSMFLNYIVLHCTYRTYINLSLCSTCIRAWCWNLSAMPNHLKISVINPAWLKPLHL